MAKAMRIDTEMIAYRNGGIKPGTCYKHEGLEVKAGNNKVKFDTLIINMGSSKTCPSKALGLCLVADECYAADPEKMYPACLPYRTRQQKYWLAATAQEIWESLDYLLSTKKRAGYALHMTIDYFRFNEAGDFWSQKCVTKLAYVAEKLQEKYNITTYGFTARSDLNFDTEAFKVKGSGHSAGNNGECRVLDKGETPLDGWWVCQSECGNPCTVCFKDSPVNVFFPIH
jgi:hypothetical protein